MASHMSEVIKNLNCYYFSSFYNVGINNQVANNIKMLHPIPFNTWKSVFNVTPLRGSQYVMNRLALLVVETNNFTLVNLPVYGKIAQG